MVCFLRQSTCLDIYPLDPPRPSVMISGRCYAHKAHCAKLAGGLDSNGWVFAGSRETILAREIYCAKPNLEPESQSGSWVCKGLGTQSPRSIREYDLANVIAIRSLTQPLTREMSSSILAAMIQLKVASTTWSSLPRISSTERTNRKKCFRCSWKLRPCLSLFIFFHLGKILSIPSFL